MTATNNRCGAFNASLEAMPPMCAFCSAAGVNEQSVHITSHRELKPQPAHKKCKQPTFEHYPDHYCETADLIVLTNGARDNDSRSSDWMLS